MTALALALIFFCSLSFCLCLSSFSLFCLCLVCSKSLLREFVVCSDIEVMCLRAVKVVYCFCFFILQLMDGSFGGLRSSQCTARLSTINLLRASVLQLPMT